jgi:hypothetical protein
MNIEIAINLYYKDWVQRSNFDEVSSIECGVKRRELRRMETLSLFGVSVTRRAFYAP